MPRGYLVITADDYGIGAERDRGIAECYKAGAVTRTSLLVNGVSARTGVQLAKQVNMPMGLHLNLTEGNHISKRENVASLLNSEGYFLGMFGFPEALAAGKVNLSQVDTEIRSQIDLFVELTGHLPHYVDGHQHVHVLPDVAEVFASVLADYDILWTRLPAEDMTHVNWVGPPLNGFFDVVIQNSLVAKPVFQSKNIKFTDHYFGMSTMSRNLTFRRITDFLDRIFPDDGDSSSCELMVHPGYPCTDDVGGCGDGPDEFTKSSDRKYELDVIVDNELATFYKKKDLKLCLNPSV